MLNTLAAGRHLAARLLAAQLVVALVAGALFWLQGRHAAMGAAAGAVLVALGTALMASRALTRGRPDVVLMRVLTGMLLKWLVVLGGLYVVLVIWHLPPLPTIVGLVAALAVNLMALKFKEQ